MSISDDEAQKLKEKFKRSLKGSSPEPLPKDHALENLAQAMDRCDLEYMNKSLAKALVEGTLVPSDLTGHDSDSPMHDTLRQARYRSFPAQSSKKPHLLMNAWETMARMGAALQAAQEIDGSGDGWGPTLRAVQLGEKQFRDSTGHHGGLEYKHLEIGTNPEPGIFRIGFRLNQIVFWKGDEIEDVGFPKAKMIATENDFEREYDDDNDRLVRVRLGDHGYVEMSTGSYYDDERNNDYTMGVLTIGQTAEVLSRFIGSRRSLFEIERFLLDAKEDVGAMVEKIDSGIPVDLRTEHGYQSQRALSIACCSHNEEAIDELLRRHANPNRGPGENESPLGCVLDSTVGRNMFWSTGQEEGPILEGREVGRRCLERLIAAGANVSEVASEFRKATPLMLACDARNTEIFAMLLKAGADTEAKNSKGLDIFEYARERKADNICALLDGWKAAQAIEQALPKADAHHAARL